MMRKTGVLCGVATAALVATGALSAAGAASGGPTISGAQTLRFSLHFSPFFFTDSDGNGRPSKGDQLVFNDLLFADGHQVGRDGGACTVVNNGNPLFGSCTGSIALRDGQITFQWLNSPPHVKQVAVTGGTGRYRNVRGDGTIVEFASGPRGTMTLHLLP